MAGRGRQFGIVSLLLTVGVACTQLFADPEQNTLARRDPGFGPAPSGTAPLQPGEPGAAGICSPGQMRCEGALLQTCSDDLSTWVTVQRCGAAALCQAAPATCLPATCAPDEMTCAGAVLQKCNAERTGWELFNTCLSPAHCNANLRQCLTEPCSPGDRRCDRSQTDQSPVLEVCRDDRSGWSQLDACVTRELCDQTLTSVGLGGLALGSDGMVQIQPASDPSTVVQCNLPACAAGETRCDGARLQFCSEGRTGWITAEECASEALCQRGAESLGSSGTPQCAPAACASGQHRCSETGMLQVCSEDRSGFVDQEQCIGAPFCNAVLADQGQSGCTDAPCEAGQMQCNGAQIQVCRGDRTGLDPVGAPCESAALCNADDPSNAFCEEPLCRRGPTSGDEFQCEGTQLQRCNESLTVLDTVQTCVTAALCDASQRQNGCRPPVCQPGQFSCGNGFLQACNADQTGFENIENCGSQAQCDANAGRCADPCEPGSTRCNATNGDLERCNDRLTGWQPIADCPSVQLCDAQNARCRICVPNEFSCADGQLRQCDADGRTFARVNIPPECALTPSGGGGIRACQGNTVVVNACALGCTQPENRCRECQPGQTQCTGNGQIRRCGDNGLYGNPTSCSDSNVCNGIEACVNNQCTPGTGLNCNDNNPCTNDTCNPQLGCQRNNVNNGTACGDGNACNGSETCQNGNCSPGAAPNCNDNNPCTNDFCNPQSGCQRSNVANGTACGDGNACNGNETCQNGNCASGGALNCNDNNPCTNDTCNPQFGCQRSNVANRLQCVNGDIQSCNNGVSTTQDCGANSCNAGSTTCNACNASTPATCAGTQRRVCVNGQFQNQSCPAGQQCQNGACVTTQICTPNSVTCTGNTRTVCNALGTDRTTQNCPLGCNGTSCRVQECDPAARECVGSTRTICSEQGTILGTQTCQFGCSANGGLCNTCQPNSVTCTGTTRTTCLASGAGTSTQVCPMGCSGTACRVCTPGTAECRGLTLSACNAAGTGFTVTTCDVGDACSAAEARCISVPR